MAVLERLFRRYIPPKTTYKPFTERPYRGSYPLGSAQRNVNTVARYRIRPAQGISLYNRLAPKTNLFTLYENRRTWHPEGAYRPSRSLVQNYPRITETPPTRTQASYIPVWKGDDYVVPHTGEILLFKHMNPFKITWEHPLKMIVCLRRKMRKEMMHALGIAGKTGFKPKHLTPNSYVKCF